jgi:hypothetical protein
MFFPWLKSYGFVSSVYPWLNVIALDAVDEVTDVLLPYFIVIVKSQCYI